MTRRRALALVARSGAAYLVSRAQLAVSGGAAAVAPLALRYGDAPQQVCDLLAPAGKGPHPVAVVLHGGFWMSAYGRDLMTPLCASLLARGIATWNVEYRRVGEPGGGWPGTFQDVGAAIDHLRSIADAHHLDLARVATLGHSAGGHLAVWAAARGRVPAASPVHAAKPLRLAAAVSLAGVVDLARGFELGLGRGAVESLMGGSPAQYPDRYAAGSPSALVPIGVRQVLVHGTRDDRVPYEMSRDYRKAAAAKGDPVELLRLVDVGHFEPIDPAARAWRVAEDEVVALLAPRQNTGQ